MIADTIHISILIFLYLFISLPLGIASIVLGALHPGTCDVTDAMNLNVSKYLLGLGISSITVSMITTLLLIIFLISICCKNPILGLLSSCALIIFNIIVALFGTCWCIVGGVVLFRSNVDCIRVSSVHVIYALVLWCLSILGILKSCCSVKIKINNNDKN